MIVVHHLNNSRSQRILWMLEEAGIDFEIKGYQRDPQTNLAPPSLKQVHPLGKSPVITDGDITVAESGAILEYLANQYAPQLRPDPKTEAGRQATYWLHFAEGSMMPPLVARLVFEKIKQKAKPFFIKVIAKKIASKAMDSYYGPNIKANFEFVEAHLKKHTWFAGDEISIADFQMSFPLEAAVARGTASQYPAICEFVKRIQSRPAYVQALAKGGEYEFAKASQ